MTARMWRMSAGHHSPDKRNREDFYWHFGSEWYVRQHGDVPVPVVLTEDPDGRYYGWIGLKDTAPVMVQPHKWLFDMQFPYGADADAKAGRGVIVRLSVARADGVETPRVDGGGESDVTG